MDLRTIILAAALLLSAGQASAESPDSWTVKEVNSQVPLESVEKWCQIGGSKVRYTNFPLPGYQPCGNLSIQKTCDATGQRFFGAGPSPHSYLDCAKGRRLQISYAKTPENNPPSNPSQEQPAGDIGTELSRLDKERKNLDSLLDSPKGKKGSSPSFQGFGDTNGGRGSGIQELMRDLPVDPRQLADLLKSIKQRNAELDHIFDDQ